MFKYAVKSNVFRDHFSEHLDEVIRERPILITRRRDQIFAISSEHLAGFIENVSITARLESEEDGTYIAIINEIEDVFATGETKEEALTAVAVELVEYADIYYERFNLYYHAPNRKPHYPIVMKILLLKDSDAVLSLLRAELQRA